jgi:hypothetical protein
MDGDWLRDCGIVLTESSEGTASLESDHFTKIARALDEEPDELMISARVLVRAYGGSAAAFEMRSGTWRIDLPTGVAKAVLAVGTEATGPNSSRWSAITRKSLITRAPSAIAHARSDSTRPRS